MLILIYVIPIRKNILYISVCFTLNIRLYFRLFRPQYHPAEHRWRRDWEGSPGPGPVKRLGPFRTGWGRIRGLQINGEDNLKNFSKGFSKLYFEIKCRIWVKVSIDANFYCFTFSKISQIFIEIAQNYYCTFFKKKF